MSRDQASDHAPVTPARARKTPVILTFGLKPERFLGFEGRIDAVLEPPAQDDADILVSAIASGIEHGGHVVAIGPRRIWDLRPPRS